MKLRNLKNQITYCLSALVPKQKDMWTFGAWLGNRYSDNPKAFLSYMVNNYPEYRYNWISKVPINDPALEGKCRILEYGSPEARKAVLRSKFIVTSHGSEDLCTPNLTGGAIRIQLFHGVGWKHYGRDIFKPSGNKIKDYLKKLNYRWAQWLEARGDVFECSSEKNKKTLMRALGAKEKSFVNAGQPRNEIFYDTEYCDRIKEKILFQLGITDTSTKIIAYLPTFRDSGIRRFSFLDIEQEIEGYLDHVVIIEKSHFGEKTEDGTYVSKHIINGAEINTQELMAAANIVVSDYSSCWIDFLCTGRPVVQFLYDYGFYKDKDRGLYFPVEEMDCGHVAYDEKELIEIIGIFCREGLQVTDKQKHVKETMLTYESPRNSEIIYQEIERRYINRCVCSKRFGAKSDNYHYF